MKAAVVPESTSPLGRADPGGQRDPRARGRECRFDEVVAGKVPVRVLVVHEPPQGDVQAPAPAFLDHQPATSPSPT